MTQNITNEEPSVVHVRVELKSILARDSDLDEFCQNYFPIVHEKFTNGMDRTTKINILFQYATPREIGEKLLEREKYINNFSIVSSRKRISSRHALFLAVIFVALPSSAIYWLVRFPPIKIGPLETIAVLAANQDSKYASNLVQEQLMKGYKIVPSTKWESQALKLEIDPDSRKPEDLVRMAAALGTHAIINTSNTFDGGSAQWITTVSIIDGETGRTLGVLNYSTQKLAISNNNLGQAVKETLQKGKSAENGQSGPTAPDFSLPSNAKFENLEQLSGKEAEHAQLKNNSNERVQDGISGQSSIESGIKAQSLKMDKWRVSSKAVFDYFARSPKSCSDIASPSLRIYKVSIVRESTREIIRGLEMQVRCTLFPDSDVSEYSKLPLKEFYQQLTAAPDGYFKFAVACPSHYRLSTCYVYIAYEHERLPVHYFLDRVYSSSNDPCLEFILPYRDRDDSLPP